MEERRPISIAKYLEVWAVLRLTRDAMQKAMEDELRDMHLSIAQTEIIFAIKASSVPATASEIARQHFRQRHTIKETLDRMEKQGLVRRVNDLPRKNSYRVILTEKGEDLYRRALDLKVIPAVSASLSSEEIETLVVIMEKIRNAALDQITTMSPRDIGQAKERLATWMTRLAPSEG